MEPEPKVGQIWENKYGERLFLIEEFSIEEFSGQSAFNYLGYRAYEFRGPNRRHTILFEGYISSSLIVKMKFVREY